MEYYVGQIFEEMYPSEAAEWCNAQERIGIDEIEPITKEVEEQYEEFNSETQEIETKTCTVEKTIRRFQIQEVPEPSEEEIKEHRIAELKAELDSTDYKIIKCSECSLAGEEMPYDIVALHAQRQALRDEINELEGK